MLDNGPGADILEELTHGRICSRSSTRSHSTAAVSNHAAATVGRFRSIAEV
jgi:hypothetical protein